MPMSATVWTKPNIAENRSAETLPRGAQVASEEEESSGGGGQQLGGSTEAEAQWGGTAGIVGTPTSNSLNPFGIRGHKPPNGFAAVRRDIRYYQLPTPQDRQRMI